MAEQTQDVKEQNQEQSSLENSIEEILKKKEAEWKEEMSKAVSKAVIVEKEKLYDTLAKEREEKRKLEEKLKAIEEEEMRKKKEEEDKAREEMEAKERLKLIEEKLDADSKRFQEIMAMKEKEFQAELLRRDLALYKERKIAEAGGAIIPELVTGNLFEEIDASVEIAKQRYISIAEATKKQALDEAYKNGKVPEPSGNSRTPESKASDRLDWAKLMTMPRDEFMKYKEQFEKEFFKGD